MNFPPDHRTTDELRDEIQSLQSKIAKLEADEAGWRASVNYYKALAPLSLVEEITALRKSLTESEASNAKMGEAMKPALQYLRHVQNWSTHGPASLNTQEVADSMEEALPESKQTKKEVR